MSTTEKCVVGIDPGEAKLGLSAYYPHNAKMDYFLCDLREVVVRTTTTASTRSKKQKKPGAKQALVKKTKRVAKTTKYKRTSGRNIIHLPNIIEQFVRSLGDTVLRHARLVVIEEQKISTTRIKYIALLLYQTIRLVYPTIPCYFLDPRMSRSFFNITVRKKNHPNATKSELRLIRKRLSFDHTHVLQDTAKRHYAQVFTLNNEFCVDPYEAGLMAVYAAHHYPAPEDDDSKPTSLELPHDRFYANAQFMLCSLFNQTVHVAGPVAA